MRSSAFRGTWVPNKRPYLVLNPDVYVSIQGETTVIGCGECRKKINFNNYITQISTEASTDSAPGSATITLSVPDTDVNNFYAENSLVIIPMMEIEIYSKGYYLVGGYPQYYKIFWGVVSSVTRGWNNGATTLTISCKDILRWWELTSVTQNPAFLERFGGSAGNYQLWNNKFAAMNHYAVIIDLARDAMGDFLLTTNSFIQYKPEQGAESGVIGQYAADMMAYWQLKFANIQSSLVLYGASGNTYTLSGVNGTVSPQQVSEEIFKKEREISRRNKTSDFLFTNPDQISAFKQELNKAGNVDFMQTESQTKLQIAFQARDQSGYEFFCDPSGDIVYKPPFYNMNVLPNKPVSWIQDFEILDISFVDSEAEVHTHVTSSGNAFGGTMDWGLNDEITTPRAGVYDYHLLKRYGWRRSDLQVEWAGDPRKLFYHLLDWMDRINAKRHQMTVTIPIRPELRLGFPIWVPCYDSFFYIAAISHQFAVGGQATTTLTLSAKRSKFIAPRNIGEIKRAKKSGGSLSTRDVPASIQAKGSSKTSGSLDKSDLSYEISFPDRLGDTTGLSNSSSAQGTPAMIRDTKTGKLLGYPNVVMVYRSAYGGEKLAKIMEAQGKVASKNPAKQNKNKNEGKDLTYDSVIKGTYQQLLSDDRAKIVARLRAHRYEAGMTNSGAYDYAVDRGGDFLEMQLIPVDKVVFGAGTDGVPDKSINTVPPEISLTIASDAERTNSQKAEVNKEKELLAKAKQDYKSALEGQKNAEAILQARIAKKMKGRKKLDPPPPDDYQDTITKNLVDTAKEITKTAADEIKAIENRIKLIEKNLGGTKRFANLNLIVRPVTDEFGFEVIGHYRYGRGVFLDSAGIQIRQPESRQLVNRLSIPFAPTAGLLTESSLGTSNLDQSSQAFSAMYEAMQPQDFVTGASFTRTSARRNSDGSLDPINGVATTGQNTYEADISNAKGKAVFIEADSLRRSKTLAEMVPNVKTGLSEVEYDNCSCGLGKTKWWTILPQNLIQGILAKVDGTNLASSNDLLRNTVVQKLNTTQNNKGVDITTTSLEESSPDNLSGSALSNSVSITSPRPSSKKSLDTAASSNSRAIDRKEDGLDNTPNLEKTFFTALNKFLSDKFTEIYKGKNMVREMEYTGGSTPVLPDSIDPQAGVEQDNIQESNSPLLNRASLGDTEALAALQNQSNFRFGLTKDRVKDFNNTKAAAQESLKAAGQAISNISVTSGSAPTKVDQSTLSSNEEDTPQQVQPPAPIIGGVVNATKPGAGPNELSFRPQTL